MASKFFSAVLIALGTIFLILSVAGIVAAWVYNEPLTLEATSRLNEVDTQLSQAQTSLQSSQMELERALRIVNAAEEAMEKLVGQSTSAENIFENIQNTLDDRLLPELKTTRERILAARAALENLRNALEGVSSFLSFDLNLPDE
ncbi:MAG TPA: hypothetical protein VFQ23_24040, partial [Anaerolineales bacterium]|nr:hypothetical protein [Anaerolineales bacterium]